MAVAYVNNWGIRGPPSGRVRLRIIAFFGRFAILFLRWPGSIDVRRSATVGPEAARRPIQNRQHLLQTSLAEIAHHATRVCQRNRSRLRDTTTAMASEISVMPMAARCRVPTCSTVGDWASGSTTPAATTRSPWMITAPSCSGALGQKMLSISSLDSNASTAVPFEAYSPRCVERSITSKAPKRRSASCCAERAIVSARRVFGDATVVRGGVIQRALAARARGGSRAGTARVWQ